MKIRHWVNDGVFAIEIAGEIDSSKCHCVQSFWDCHVPDSAAGLRLDLRRLDAIDAEGVRQLSVLLTRQLELGARVAVLGPPAALAEALPAGDGENLTVSSRF